MTAVLNELRRLEEAEARGALRKDEVRFRRERLIEMVEDAEVVDSTAEPPPAKADASPELSTSDQLWILCALIIGAFVGITAMVAWAVRDMTIGFTVGVTFLAVVIVQAFKSIKL